MKNPARCKTSRIFLFYHAKDKSHATNSNNYESSYLINKL